MRIIFLTDNFPPEVNAPATRVYERACYWVQWGHQVTVITCAPNFPEGKVYPGYKNKWYQKEKIDGIQVIRVKTFMAPNKGVILRTLDFISYMMMAIIAGIGQRRPDVIVATSPQFFAGLGGWVLSVIKRRPFILELGDLWPDSIAAVGAVRSKWLLKHLEQWEKFLYRRSQAIIPVTEAFQRNLVARGVEAKKITVIRNGVDINRCEHWTKDLELARTYQIQDCFVVGYIGTLGMAHGLRNALKAAYVLKDRLDIRWLFVGNGAERDHLVTLAEEWGLNNVLFIPRQPKNQIARYWSLCDMALIHLKNHPVFSEVIPSKLFEAMAMMKPVILVAPEGEAGQIVHQEGIGVTVPPDEPDELAKVVQHYSQAPDELTVFEQASRLAAPRYSREQQAQSMLNVLQKSVNG